MDAIAPRSEEVDSARDGGEAALNKHNTAKLRAFDYCMIRGTF
jgi:hypothetical protein